MRSLNISPKWRTRSLVIFTMSLSVFGGGALAFKHSGTHEPVNPSSVNDKKSELYRCPMHPAITSREAGQCPICHMDLQKVDDEEAEETAPAQTSDQMEGRAGFSLTLGKQQLIGVATTHVSVQPLKFEVRATGRVAFDPDLYTAIEEYRQALVTRSQSEGNSFEIIRQQARELVQSANTRLRLLGLSQIQINDLTKSDSSGLELVLPNGKVWIYAEVYEYEVGGLKSGQQINVQAPAVPGKVFTGKISSISPVVNSPTRTVRVRALVPDPGELLRPDTFVNVGITIDHGSRLAVPEDAVMHSGKGTFVFVVKGNGRFEPTPVVLGVKANHFYEVLSGVKDGDAVVSAANFLIDSESRLRNALKIMQPSGSTK